MTSAGAGGLEASSEPISNSNPQSARRTGRCKWFNVVKGFGFVTPDDGQPDVFLHQTVIQMQGFRSLAEGELVEFEAKSCDKGFEATLVCGPGGSDCKGTERRPVGKRKSRKVRCYNCGEFASHVAAKCPLGTQPKRCHHCKSDAHLIADCPERQQQQQSPASGAQHSESSSQQQQQSKDSSKPKTPGRSSGRQKGSSGKSKPPAAGDSST